MSEDNNERLEARLNAFIETQKQLTQNLKDELANTRQAVEREADAAKEINNSAHLVLQATERQLAISITRYTRFAGWVSAIVITFFTIFGFMSYRNFNDAVIGKIDSFITGEKIDSLLKKQGDIILAQAKETINKEIESAKEQVASIRGITVKAEQELQKIAFQSKEFAQLSLQTTLSSDVRVNLKETTKKLISLEAQGAKLTSSDYITMGNQYYFNKEYDKALQVYDKAIALDPNNVDILINKGVILDKLKRYDGALQVFDKAIALDPDSANVWNNKGCTLRNLKRYDEALRASDKAIALDSDNTIPMYRYNKSTTLSKLKRYDEALVASDKAIAIEPDNANVWYSKGNALLDLKRYSEALQAFDKAIALDPNNVGVLINKGVILNKLKRHDEALQFYDKVIALEPENAIAWNNKSSTLLDLKRYDEALLASDKAIDLDSDYAVAWYNKGNIYFNLRNRDQALHCLCKAIDLDPSIVMEYGSYEKNGR